MDIRMTDDAPVNKTAVTVAAAADELMVLLTVGKEGLCIFLAVGRMIAFKAIKRLFPYCLQSPSKPRAMKVACRMGQKGHPASFVKGRHGLFDRGKTGKSRPRFLMKMRLKSPLHPGIAPYR